jgi:hypothetical protein
MGDVDISRNAPFQQNKKYLFERAKESLGLLYADHFPYLQKKTARGEDTIHPLSTLSRSTLLQRSTL